MSTLRRSPLSAPEMAVFVSGVVSIGIEILSGRIIAPEFGNSIYTWGSVIGVNLGALGLGYHVAGKRAPERASRAALVTLLLQSAAFVAFLLAAADVLLRFADALPVPPRFAPLLPVAALFGPPVFLLGYVSPYAAELSAEPTSGSASGRIYAVGTIGSLVGAFATTFFLVPWLSVPVVELGFGLVLVASAVLLARPSTQQVLKAVAIVVVLGVAFVVNGAGLAIAGTVVHEEETAYQQLRVVDADGVRTLYLDGAPQSATYVDDREGYVFEYNQYTHLPLLFTKEVDSVLFVGGGGFSAPKGYLQRYPNATVDVVELDPAVVRAAREYFAVPDSPRLTVHVGDGREFLEETDRTYDVVVLDAYRKDRVPMHMTTVEFFELVSQRLDEDGTLVANVISATDGPGSAFYRAQYKTMRAAFPHVSAFPTSDTPFLQNVELVATKAPGLSKAELVTRARENVDRVGMNLTAVARDYRGPEEVPTEDVPVLRDDRAPVERLLDPQLGRRYVVDRTNETATATP